MIQLTQRDLCTTVCYFTEQIIPTFDVVEQFVIESTCKIVLYVDDLVLIMNHMSVTPLSENAKYIIRICGNISKNWTHMQNNVCLWKLTFAAAEW